MNLEFHFWVILFISRRAGVPINEARTIACASQLTDERTTTVPIIGPRGEDLIPATQAFAVSDESDAVRRAFHFIPGDIDEAAIRRKDGRRHSRVVTANSPAAKALLVAALKTANPYRIGIALHAYADTWAHSNFCGTLDSFNAFFVDDPIPSVGHAAALKKPDLLNEEWIDPRLKPEFEAIRNRERFMKAARQCYKYLAIYARRSFDDVDFMESELNDLWGANGLKRREERFSDYAVLLNESAFARNEWFAAVGLADDESIDDAGDDGYSSISSRIRKLARRGSEILFGDAAADPKSVSEKYYESDLFGWSQAAAEHRRLAEKS